VEASAWREPADVLPGDGGDAIVVLVVMQHRNAGRFSGGGDQQVWMADRTMVKATLVGELLIDLKRPSPLLDADRAGWQRVKLALQDCELGRVAGAVEELKPDHVARRDPSLDEVVVKRDAQFAADSAGPDPGAGVSQMHLCELSLAADLLERVGGEIGEVALGEPFASGTVDNRTQCSMDRISGSCRPEHDGRCIDELRVEVDIRAPYLRLAHLAQEDTPLCGRTIHIVRLAALAGSVGTLGYGASQSAAVPIGGVRWAQK
jgi:hypothetical protein